jgi:hypothetical protein
MQCQQITKDSSIIAITPFNPKGNYQTACIKVRFLPYLLGNGCGLSGLIGVEYGFGRRHSLGLDFVFLSATDSQDTPGNPNNPAPTSNGIDRSFVLSYRYYLNFNKLRTKKRCPIFYTGLMARYGWENAIVDLGYNSENLIADHSTHTSEGFLLGMLFKPKDAGNDSKVVIDFNLGPLFKQTDVTNIYNINQHDMAVQGHMSSCNLHLGLSVNFWFTR